MQLFPLGMAQKKCTTITCDALWDFIKNANSVLLCFYAANV